jgi:hypothetical protein
MSFSSPYRPLRPGQPIVAKEINRALTDLQRSALSVSGAGFSDELGQTIIDVRAPKTRQIKITGGSNPYSWVEVAIDETGLVYETGDASGSTGSLAARERTGNERVPVDTIVEATLDENTNQWMFTYLADAGSFFPAKVTARTLIDGKQTYDWTEQEFATLGASGTDKSGGRSGTSSSHPAYEINNKIVANNTYVWVRKGFEGESDDDYRFAAPDGSVGVYTWTGIKTADYSANVWEAIPVTPASTAPIITLPDFATSVTNDRVLISVQYDFTAGVGVRVQPYGSDKINGSTAFGYWLLLDEGIARGVSGAGVGGFWEFIRSNSSSVGWVTGRSWQNT